MWILGIVYISDEVCQLKETIKWEQEQGKTTEGKILLTMSLILQRKHVTKIKDWMLEEIREVCMLLYYSRCC